MGTREVPEVECDIETDTDGDSGLFILWSKNFDRLQGISGTGYNSSYYWALSEIAEKALRAAMRDC